MRTRSSFCTRCDDVQAARGFGRRTTTSEQLEVNQELAALSTPAHARLRLWRFRGIVGPWCRLRFREYSWYDRTVCGTLEGDSRPCADIRETASAAVGTANKQMPAIFSTSSRDLRLTYSGDIRWPTTARKTDIFLMIGML